MIEDSENICGYCKQADSEVLYHALDVFGCIYYINKCNKCKAYFLAPRPGEKALEEAYDSSYYGEKEEKFKPTFERVMDYFRLKRAKYLSKHLADNSKVLDIGCGNGRFLLNLLKFGNFRLYGTELEGNSAKRASIIAEINLKIGSLKKEDFEPDTFDAVTLFHVFEHLTEPQEALQTISEIIKKDGVLVISFPNITSIQSKLFKGKWLHLDPPRHLFYFKPRDFIKLMNTYGFELVRQKYFSIEQNPYGMSQSILNLFFTKREILFERLKGNKHYAKECSWFNIFMQKAFFIGSFPLFILSDLFASLLRKGATVEFTFKKANH